MSDGNFGAPHRGPQSNLPPLTATGAQTTVYETADHANLAELPGSLDPDFDIERDRGLNAPRIIGILVLAALAALFVWLLINRTSDADPAETGAETEQVADGAGSQSDGADDAMADDESTTSDAMADDANNDGAATSDAMADDESTSDAMADDESTSDAMGDDANDTGSTTVVDAMLNNPDLSIVVDGMRQLGLDETLASGGPFTIFAPTNDAFFLISEEEASRLLSDEDSAETVLSHHVLSGLFTAENILTALETQGGSLTVDSLSGEEITLELVGEQVVLNGTSIVIDPDQSGENGVVHTISELLVPLSLSTR